MLKKVNRLKKHYQYAYVYRAGHRVSGKCVSIFACTSKTKNIKIGFSVTKKVGKAVKRNKARRRLREIIKKQLPNLKQNYNIIIVAKDNILDFSFKEIEMDIAYLLNKLQLVIDEKSI